MINRECLEIGNLLENLIEGAYVIDNKGEVVFWNKSAEMITGWTQNEVMGRKCSDGILVHLDEFCAMNCPGNCIAREVIISGKTAEAELYFHHKEGHRVLVNTKIIPLNNKSGKADSCVQLFSEKISGKAYKKRIEELEKLSLSDHLTEIGNRKMAEISLETGIYKLKKYSIPFGLVFADIDDFKIVNDKFGHSAGDSVLKMVAKTIEGNLRHGDKACRWGGEEFVLITENAKIQETSFLAERIRRLVESSFLTIAGNKAAVTISAGVTEALKEDSVQALIDRADSLMFSSKKRGKNVLTLG